MKNTVQKQKDILNDYELTDPRQFDSLVRAGAIKLPYKRTYTSDKVIREKFNKLKNLTRDDFAAREVFDRSYSPGNTGLKQNEMMYEDGESKSARHLLFVNKATDYTDTGAISDMFQEHNRLRARYIGAKLSPHDLFYANPELISDDCMKTAVYNGKITPYNAREALYWQSNECSAFNPVIMLYFINKFGALSVLDPCAGWGDRLVAAIAADVRYVGVDPNTDLFAGYFAIKDFFLPKESTDDSVRNKFTLINNKIQTAILPRRVATNPASGISVIENETFDMVFTSPPYFTMEEYTGDGRVSEQSEDEWLWNFLWPLVDISLKRLNPGGHLVLALNQQRGDTYIRALLHRMEKKPMVKYLGVISYTDARITNPQPVWIWQKSECTKPSPAETHPDSASSQSSETNSSAMSLTAQENPSI